MKNGEETTIRVGTVDLDDMQDLKEALKQWGDLDTWKEPQVRLVPEGVEVQFELLS